jgi:hypothetical protein
MPSKRGLFVSSTFGQNRLVETECGKWQAFYLNGERKRCTEC